jgi:Peptidase inhibitor family I36
MGAGLDQVLTGPTYQRTQEILMLHALRRLSPQPKLTIAIAAILAIGLLVAMTATQVAAPAGAKSNPAKSTAAATTLDAATAGTPVTALASQDATCDVGDVCLFYTGFDNSRYDTAHNDPSLQNNHFITAGSGQGSTVTNNAQMVWNNDPNTSVKLCTGPNQTGTCASIAPGVLMALSSTYSDNVESIIWADSSN